MEPEKNKVGRPKNIESPELMIQLFETYRIETKANPFKVKDWVGKDGIEINREKEKPLTMEGFQNYLDREGVITDVTDYFENKDNRYKDFVRICSRIKREIRQDQIDGGMAGIYNPSITQRLNGLKEQSETEIKGSLNIPNLPDIGNRKI